jgi:hypothetical protein
LSASDRSATGRKAGLVALDLHHADELLPVRAEALRDLH